MNPISFEEKWRVTVSKFQVLSAVFIILLLIMSLTTVLLNYTKFGAYIAPSANNEIRKELLEKYDRTLQFENTIANLEVYIANLQRVILGEVSLDSVFITDEKGDFSVELDTTRRASELQLSALVNERDKNLSDGGSQTITELFLMDPVAGRISQAFHPVKHPAVDIVTTSNTPVLSVLEGIVVHTGFDEDGGWMVIIKHPNEILSVYKHLSKVTTKTGGLVKTAETIGVVGNSGTRTTGPHLHFELWSSNGPLNPMDYLSFGR